MDCLSDQSSNGSFDTIITIVTRCDKQVLLFLVRFIGGDFNHSFNIQEVDKFDFSDFYLAVPTSVQEWIWVHKRGDERELFFEGWVGVGEDLPLRCDPNDNCGSGNISTDSTFHIYLVEYRVTLVQLANFHTSCYQNIFLEDRFGGIKLFLFVN